MPFNAVKWAWNGVEVRGDDGLLHSGRVIDVVDGGLVVEFGQSSRLIPFGAETYCRHPQGGVDGPLDINDERPVEVLLRLQPEEPWKWYPATLLHDFGLVRVTLPDRQFKGFVSQDRILSTERSLWRCSPCEKGYFSKELVVVGSELGASLMSDDQLILAVRTTIPST